MLKSNISLNYLRKLFIRVKNVLLVAHPSPDIDCLAAMKVIKKILKDYFYKKVILYSKDPINTLFKNIFNFEENEIVNEVNLSEFDCIIAIETGNYKRFLEALKIENNDSQTIFKEKIILNFDHHASNDLFGNYYYVDTSACSINEALYDIIVDTEINIDEEIAHYIVMGIISDTGNLKYSSLTSKSLKILSELRNLVNWSNIFYDINKKSINEYKLLSIFYSRLKIEDKIAYSYVLKSDLEKLNLSLEDVNNIIENLDYLDETEIYFNVLELEKGKSKVSIRSRRIPIREIAESFGGGGHNLAAGFRIKKDPIQTIDTILPVIKNLVRSDLKC
ncbi:MAG: DHHA1 domain-containing protein [bacterium]|nr:DHHA1 domain-containing protein [bacterium]